MFLRFKNLMMSTRLAIQKILKFYSSIVCDLFELICSKIVNILCLVNKRWIMLGIKSRWTPIIQLALKLVTDQGRMKFTRPTYRYCIFLTTQQ